MRLRERSSRRSERHDQVGRAIFKKGLQVVDKLVFGVWLLDSSRDHGEVLNDQRPGRAPLQLLPKRLGVFAPRLEVLAIRVEDQNGLGLCACKARPRSSEHRHCHDKPNQPSREATLQVPSPLAFRGCNSSLILWRGQESAVVEPK